MKKVMKVTTIVLLSPLVLGGLFLGFVGGLFATAFVAGFNDGASMSIRPISGGSKASAVQPTDFVDGTEYIRP